MTGSWKCDFNISGGREGEENLQIPVTRAVRDLFEYLSVIKMNKSRATSFVFSETLFQNERLRQKCGI